MKKLILPYILVLAIGFSSCDLDMFPHSQVATDNLTEDDVTTMLTGTYNRMQNRNGVNGYVLFDVFGGNLLRGGASGSSEYITLINDFMTPSNGTLLAQWQAYYTNLYQVNELLLAADKLPDSESKTQILGAAHFFRGMIYYNLVTRWGGVPIVRTPTNEKLARDTEEDTWAFVEEELQRAIDWCPEFSGYFYVSKSAAMALMARTKLSMKKMGEAKELAEALITDGRFALADFDQIFRGKDNREIIFSFANLLEESSVNISALYYTRNSPGGGSYQYAPTSEVIGLFIDSDKRKSISVDNHSGNDVINKYPGGESGSDPIIITRLAEMYLVSAEAQGYPDGLARLNELRNFRGLGNVSATNEETFIKAVLDERRKELLAEGFRWYDCVRLGVAETEIGINSARTKFPIPEREITLNGLLEPNPGYDM